MEANSSVVQDAWLWSGSRKVFLTEEGNVADVNMQDGMYDMEVEADKVPMQMEGTASRSPDQLINLEGISVDDVLQMKFSTPEEASDFYNNYSRVKGFASRQGKKIKNSIGQIVRYTFVCNTQGFREKKWLEKMDRKKEHKVVTRCGCLAEMRIKKKDGTGNWYVSQFIDEHNHEMVSGKFVNYLRSHRKISEVEIAHLTSEETTDHAATYRSRLGAFSQICKRLGRVACMSDEDFKQYSKKLLSDAVVLEIKYGLRPDEPMVRSGLVRQGIKDPVRVRTKGTGRCSQAAPSVGKKRRKCSTCSRLGHRRTRCPNAPSQTSLRPREDFVLNRMTQEVQGGEKPVRTRKRKIGCDPSVVQPPIFSDSTTCIGECS
ncbi:hypothetical protein Ahy_A10g050650 [Arachis hypogaea]|uniref:FAR1 domain-containing protein n=1 Tax=Arachis hypogaea TaxID=3818 RepID=A0A445BA31_ARAHY|nr:hypothetical protein Ahy_A10g050650 [Arachis hypogaea]